jgi:hypothetical protein
VEPERVLSGCGRTVTKIRSSLHDDSLDMDMLTFLRGYEEYGGVWMWFKRIYQDRK